MKILFKNTTKYSKKTYDEFLKFHNDRFGHMYTFITLLIAIGLFYLISMQVIYHNITVAIILCVLLTIFFLWRLLHPVSEISKEYKSDKIKNKKEFTFYFYEKNFKIRDNMNHEIMKYFKLYKIYETNDFFYLYSDKTHSYIIEKSGFTKGNPDEFSKFLKTKYWWKYKRII